MREPDAASDDASLVSAVRGFAKQFGVADARTLAEAVTLHRDHARWAIWLPAADGGWAAVRPLACEHVARRYRLCGCTRTLPTS
jgi:hypothetical protein